MSVRREHRLRPGDARRAEGRDRAPGRARRWRSCGSRRRRDKLPGQLSGGQQQRVAIARAIVIEPPLVLMDEPLSNLDAKLRLEMRAEIRRIHRELGCTTIYVTHDQDEALSLADRIVVLSDGLMRQIGTPEELYARPAHPDVARLHGLPQPGRRSTSARGGRGRRRRRRSAARALDRHARWQPIGGARWRRDPPGRSASRAADGRDRGDGRDRRVPRPRLLLRRRAAPTARELYFRSRPACRAGDAVRAGARRPSASWSIRA